MAPFHTSSFSPLPAFSPSTHYTHLSQPSSTSRFYVLNDWQNTFAKNKDVSTPLPAARTSDIMLKTMGILRVSDHTLNITPSVFIF